MTEIDAMIDFNPVFLKVNFFCRSRRLWRLVEMQHNLKQIIVFFNSYAPCFLYIYITGWNVLRNGEYIHTLRWLVY